MGYTTEFTGYFSLDKPLIKHHKEYLTKFSDSRRMQRDSELAAALPDPLRIAVDLPIGEDGCYYVNGTNCIFDNVDKSVLYINTPPNGQPGLWCDWAPNEDGTQILWNGSEKFYHYKEWLQYIIDHFLTRWDYKLNGTVSWQGEDEDDKGIITINDNVVSSTRV
jgi:hypothetical protein